MILGKFFLKYEGGTGVKLTPTSEKATLKKPSLIRVNITETNAINSAADNTDSKYKKNEGYDFVILEDFESLEAEPEVKNKLKNFKRQLATMHYDNCDIYGSSTFCMNGK